MAPMTRARSNLSTKTANELMKEYYTQRASAGLIISEGVAPSAQGYGWLNAAGIFTKEQAESWKQESGELPVAPSAIKLEGAQTHTPTGKSDYEVPRALKTEEIADVVQQHKVAAQFAREAGFDGVEIHSANGYLLNEFLESKTNKRTDQYGGSFENRFRIVDEVLTAVCEVFPSTRVGIRFSPNGNFDDMGSPDNFDAFMYYMEQLNKYNLAYLHIMNGLAFGSHGLCEAVTLEHVRKVYFGRVMANCGYTPESAEKDVGAKLADMVSFGRLYIANPDLVERIDEGLELNPTMDPSTWYVGENGSKGYTTYPKFEEWKL